MRRLPLLLLALVAAPATLAEDLSERIANRTSVMFYFKAPFGGGQKSDAAGSFGFRLDRSPGGNATLLRTPVVDINFNKRGFNTLALRGSVLHQNQPASGALAPEINWWVVGGIAVGAVIVIHNENKDKNDAPVRRGPSGGN